LNPIEQSLELELSEERVHRTLLELYQDQDWPGLLAKAELLNAAWHLEAGPDHFVQVNKMVQLSPSG